MARQNYAGKFNEKCLAETTESVYPTPHFLGFLPLLFDCEGDEMKNKQAKPKYGNTSETFGSVKNEPLTPMQSFQSHYRSHALPSAGLVTNSV